MRQPAGGCFDGAGNLIVSDSKAKKIMCFGPKGDFLGNLEIFGNDGGGYLESLPSRMTDISVNDDGYLIILTPLPLGGGRDRQDRGRSGCKKSILRCKINTPEENPSDPMSRTVNGVTTKMVGSIFEEVTDVEIKEPELPKQEKSDFDRDYDDMARDTGFDDNRSQSSDKGSDRGGFGGGFRGSFRGGGGFRGRGGGGRGGIRESQRPASSSWCTKPQEKPSFLQNNDKKWDNYDDKWNKNKSRSNSRDRFGGSQKSHSRSPPRGGSNWGGSPKSSGGGGAGWGATSPNTSPKPSGGGGWGSPKNSPKSNDNNSSGGGGWGAPKSPFQSGGGSWGAPKSPTPSNGAGGGWGAPKSPIQSGGGSSWGNLTNEQAKCPVLKSPEKDDNAGWGSSKSPVKSNSGWGDSPPKPSGGGGWGDSPEEKKDSGAGWGISYKKEPTSSNTSWANNSGEFFIRPPHTLLVNFSCIKQWLGLSSEATRTPRWLGQEGRNQTFK